MADIATSTPVAACGTVDCAADATRISTFTGIVHALEALEEAEIEAAGLDPWDPATSQGAARADAALESALDGLEAACDARSVGGAFALYAEVARLGAALLGAETGSALIAAMVDLLHLDTRPPRGATGAHRSACRLAERARAVLLRLAQLWRAEAVCVAIEGGPVPQVAAPAGAAPLI